ncbi:peptidase inhibitor R3HDML [Diretmus argenteus]
MKKLARTWCCCSLLWRVEMGAICVQLLLAAILWTMPHMGAAAVLSSPTDLLNMTRAGSEAESVLRSLTSSGDLPGGRRKRDILSRDVNALLDYHNRVRSQVSPPAANMEYMVWDEGLAKSADSWASRCIWDHGPTQAMRYMGQNLSINSGRYPSITDLVRSWRDERHHFSYPNRCSGSVCSHYTQMVWASTNKMGCAIKKCSNMYVFGSIWREATLLVCNYSIKGNWVGEAPYRTGRPCSACPSSYGGSCWRNQCSGDSKTTTRIRGLSLAAILPRAPNGWPSGPGRQHCPVALALLLLPACLSVAGPERAAEAHGPSLSWPGHRQGSAFTGMYAEDGTLHFTNPGKGEESKGTF